MSNATHPQGQPAIVGIGCRLPGGIRGPQELWAALVEGRDLVDEFPPERWATMVDQLHPDQRPEKPFAAGVLDDVESFDHEYFGIGTAEAEQMDPQQRLLLEVVFEALADAGIAPKSLAGRNVGIYVGAAAFDQATLTLAPGQRASMFTASGAVLSVLSGRIAHVLGTTGEATTVDTACSSSLVAAHHARSAIEREDVELAIVAGVNLLRNPVITAAFLDSGGGDGVGVLSPSGRCHTFSTTADGYVRSEGVGTLILAPNDHAVTENRRVYAVMAGSATGHDGHTPAGLYAPSRAAQERLLRRACASAGIEPQQVDYVEPHGTSTRSGDWVDAQALATVFGAGRRPGEELLVGAHKTNLGHTEATAGIAGVITVAMMSYHGVVPPSLHLDAVHPRIAALEGLRFPTAREPWPQTDNPRTVGVTSSGFSGTGASAIFTAPVTLPHAATTPRPNPEHAVPLLVSGHTPGVLHASAADYEHALGDGTDLHQLIATVGRGRNHGPRRAVVLAREPDQTRAALAALAAGSAHPDVVGPRHTPRGGRHARTVLVFSGQGSHTESMGADLYQQFPVFAHAVESTLETLAQHESYVSGWHPRRAASPVGVAATQQATFTIQIALAALLRDWGINVGAVVGHSMGEIAAAYVAGILSLDDAARVLTARSQILEQACGDGGLLAATVSRTQAEELLSDHPEVALAADNAPASTVFTGPGPALDHLHQYLDHQGVWARRVPEGPRAHSAHLDPWLNDFTQSIATIQAQPGQVRLYSTLTAGLLVGTELGPDYWATQLRRPVRFRDTITAAAADATSQFVEVGPRPVLSDAIGATVGNVEAVIAARGEHEAARVTDLLAQLYTHGHDPAPTWPLPHGMPPADLPPLRWDHISRAWSGVEETDPVAQLAERIDTDLIPDDRKMVVRDLLATIIAETLREDPAYIDHHTPLLDLGISSISLLEPLTRIRRCHRAFAKLQITELLGDRTIADLTVVLSAMSDP